MLPCLFQASLHHGAGQAHDLLDLLPACSGLTGLPNVEIQSPLAVVGHRDAHEHEFQSPLIQRSHHCVSHSPSPGFVAPAVAAFPAPRPEGRTVKLS